MNQLIKMISRLLIAVFTGFFAVPATASHMMGADMTYQNLGGGKYKIVAKVYRDCRGIAFNSPSFGVYAGINRNNSCGSKSGLTITRVSITDVSQLCATAKPACDSNKAATGNGVEMHVYESIVDFNKAPLSDFVGKGGCCEVTFYLGQCCRNGAITTGPANDDFYTTTMINICNSLSTDNSSPEFTNRPIFYACCNQPYRFNHGLADDTRGDSMGFTLVRGIRSLPATSISYSAPFSYNYPVTPLCSGSTISCVPNPTVNPPTGFYFDGISGDMVFTPTKCNEVAIIVVEVIEYKRIGGVMKELGSTRRDMQLIVEDCLQNMVPEINGPDSMCVNEGDSVCFNVSCLDTLQGSQTVGDQVDLTWNTGIKGATFTLVSSGKNPVYRFCWKVPTGASSDLPYTFSVKAADDNCDRRALAYKGFVIKVGNCKTAGVRTIHTARDLSISPNPVRAGQVLTVGGSLQDLSWDLSTVSGVHVSQGMLSNQQLTIPSTISAGMYILRTHRFGAAASMHRLMVIE